MSQTKLNHFPKNMCKAKQSSKGGAPIVVINQLNKDRDVSNIVDKLLKKNDFSDASSLFVVVQSDDNDTEKSLDGHKSTICFPMSENHTKWKNYINNMTAEMELIRRTSSLSKGVKISAKGKKYFMEGLPPTTVLSSHNKETMFNYQYTGQCPRKKENTKNKLCQITTPNEVVQIVENGYTANDIIMDTTVDRPCCCTPKPSDLGENHPYNIQRTDVSARQVTPLLVKQGIKYDPYQIELAVEQQASYLSMNVAQVPEQKIPDNLLNSRRPDDTKPLSPPVQPCQCSPENLRELLEQAVKAGRISNMKSIGCGATIKPEVVLPSAPPSPPLLPMAPTTRGKGGDCSGCLHPIQIDDCECSYLKKIKIFKKKKCPCESQRPSKKKADSELKIGLEGLADQKCPHKPLSSVPYNDDEKEIEPNPTNSENSGPKFQTGQIIQAQCMIPAGESSQIETGEIYTQPSPKQTKFSSTIGTYADHGHGCMCMGKKKIKGIFEQLLSEYEPDPELEPIPMYATESNTTDTLEWANEAETKKIKSSLTEITPGFKKSTKKRQPPQPDPEEESSLDEAIKYYTNMKPELLRDIIESQQRNRELQEQLARYKKQEGKGDRKADPGCECPPEPPSSKGWGISCRMKGGVSPRVLEPIFKPTTLEPLPSESAPSELTPSELLSETTQDEDPFRGLKIKTGGQAAGSRGLQGICCYDVLQESFTTW